MKFDFIKLLKAIGIFLIILLFVVMAFLLVIEIGVLIATRIKIALIVLVILFIAYVIYQIYTVL